MRPFFKTWLTICLLMPLAAHATNREQRLPNVNGFTPKSHASAPSNKGKQVKHTTLSSTDRSKLVPPMATKESSNVLSRAVNVLGTPYRWGGSSPSKGFDCSGLVQWAFARNGRALPREVREQFLVGREIDSDNVKPGDLLFFDTGSKGASHVGIALDHETFVHAPRTNGVVRIERYTSSYWSRRYLGARRVE